MILVTTESSNNHQNKRQLQSQQKIELKSEYISREIILIFYNSQKQIVHITDKYFVVNDWILEYTQKRTLYIKDSTENGRLQNFTVRIESTGAKDYIQAVLGAFYKHPDGEIINLIHSEFDEDKDKTTEDFYLTRTISELPKGTYTLYLNMSNAIVETDQHIYIGIMSDFFKATNETLDLRKCNYVKSTQNITLIQNGTSRPDEQSLIRFTQEPGVEFAFEQRGSKYYIRKENHQV